MSDSANGIFETVGFAVRAVAHFAAASWVTLAWFALGGAAWVFLPEWRWLALALLLALAVGSIWVFPKLTPFAADVRRFAARRKHLKQRKMGYQVANDLALVPDVTFSADPFKAIKQLPDAYFTTDETELVLDTEQLHPGTVEHIHQRAIAYAPKLAVPADYVTISRPVPSRVRVSWGLRAPVDLLADSRPATLDTTSSAPVLGRADTGEDFTLDLVGDSWHLGLQGATRSGKSVAIYGLLAAYADASCNGRVIVGGIDPTGLLLNVWRTHPGNEYRAVGLSNLDAVTEALAAAVSEMERRISWLMEQGRDKVTPDDFATLVFALEEYPGLVAALSTSDAALSPKDRRLPRVKNAVQRLIQEGAKAGVRVILIAQRFDASIIDGAVRSNVGTRISCRVDNRDAVTMLHPDAAPETVERIRSFAPGYAYIERPAEAPQVIRFDVVEYQQYREHVMRAGATNERD